MSRPTRTTPMRLPFTLRFAPRFFTQGILLLTFIPSLWAQNPNLATGPGWSGLQPPYVIAHRGTGGMFVEHSMYAYRKTLALGNPFVEVDVFLLADGSLGVMHDTTLDRTTTSFGPTATQTRESWRQLRLKNTGTPGLTDNDLRAPMLDDVLAEFGNKAIVVVEAKNRGAGAAIVALLQKYQIKPDYTLVNSFDAAELTAASASGYPTSINIYDEKFAPDAVTLAEKKYTFITLPEERFSDIYVQKLIAAGLRVIFYTLDYQFSAKRGLQRGAVGYYTDEPFYAGVQSRMDSDPFALQTWFPGQLPLAGTDRGFYTAPDKLTVDSTATNAYSACLQGWCSPLNDGKPYRKMTLNFTLTFSDIKPDGWAGVFLLERDRPFESPDQTSVPIQGYHAVIGANGTVRIMKYDGKVPVEVARKTGKPIAPGQPAEFRISYSNGKLEVMRFDKPLLLNVDLKEPPRYYLAFDARRLKVNFSRVTATAY